MNFDLARLKSHLRDIRAVRQAVEKETHMPPTPFFLLPVIFARGRGHVPAPASCKRQQHLLRSVRAWIVAATATSASVIASVA